MIKKLTAPMLALILCLSAVGNASAVQKETEKAAAGNLHEEQFSSDHSMKEASSQFTEYFYAGDWDISLAQITLRYTAAELEENETSSVSLLLNGTQFYSGPVTPSVDDKLLELTLQLPVSEIKGGQNSLTVEHNIKTKDGASSKYINSEAALLTISKKSIVSLQYLPKETCDTVAEFVNDFVGLDALENGRSAAFVRSDADDTELEAAALVLACVSGEAVMHYDNIALKTADDEKALLSGKYSIFVCKYSSLPSALAERLSAEEKKAALSGALLSLLKPDENCNVLLITGNSDDALINAARLIGNSSYIKQVKTSWRSVSAEENVLISKKEINQYIPLTESGTSLTGSSSPSASYYIELPENRKLSYSSKLSLSMRYSDNLDFNRSLVTAYVNDVPIGSEKLEEKKAQGDTVLFDIPSDLQVNGNFAVKVVFNLEAAGDTGTYANGDAQWAWISSESMLKLTADNVDSMLFEYYPSPFVKDGTLNNVVVVLPDSPGDADLDALRQIVLTLGRSLDNNDGTLRVAHASNVGDLSKSNIISIGRYKNNKLAKENNDKAFFKFSASGNTLCSNEKMLIDPNYGMSLGTVQLLNSPYSKEKRALMLVTGESDEAMLKGVKYIGFTDNLWKVYGDGYVTDGVDVFPFRFKADNAKTQDITKAVISRTDIESLVISAGLVIVLALLSLVLLLRKHRRAGKESKG